MADLKERATALWTKLLKALNDDGLIATCVQQSGPATTHVIVELCQQLDGWLPPGMKPQPGREIVAHLVTNRLQVLHYNDEPDSHGERWWVDDEGRCYGDAVIRAWRFVGLPT